MDLVVSRRRRRRRRRRRASINNILIWLEGPQLVTISGSRNSSWIGVAVEEIEGMEYPFFCVRLSKKSLKRYFDGKVDLWSLFCFPFQSSSDAREYMAFDYAKIDSVGEFLLNPISPKEDYFPGKGIFFEDNTESIDFEKEGIDVSNDNDDEYKVNIDGSWALSEFSYFSNKVASVYSFLHCIRTLESSDKDERSKTISRLRDTFVNHPWNGGFSYVHFYNDLSSCVPANDALEVKEIKYASPGHISLCGHKTTFDDLDDAIKSMTDDFYLARKSYSSLGAFLRANKLVDNKEDLKGSIQVQDIIEKYVREMCERMSLNGLEDIYESCNGNWITTAKIVMSFYRRIKDLTDFYRDGRAAI